MKKILRIIVTVLVIVSLFTALKNEFARFFLNNANYGLQPLTVRNSRDDDNNDLQLFVGSSMFRQGLDIDELDETNMNNYILSYNGAQPFLMYYELNYLLNNDVEIQTLYVDMFANTCMQEPWVSDDRLFLDTDTKFKLDIWGVMKDSSDAGFNDFWQMMVTSNNDKLLTWFADYPVVNSMFREGGNLAEKTGESQQVLDSQLGTLGERDVTVYHMNEQQKEYLIDIIDLCRDKSINLVFIETPKYKTANREQTYIDIMTEYCELLKVNNVPYYLTKSTVKSLKEYKGITAQWDEDHIISFDETNHDYFIDAIHLSSDGRVIFTRKLVDKIQKINDN